MAYANGEEVMFSGVFNTVSPVVVQESGNDEAKVMSQKATTDAICNSFEWLNTKGFKPRKIVGEWVSYATGLFSSKNGEGWARSDYIACIGNSKIKINNYETSSGLYYGAWYDCERNYIRGLSLDDEYCDVAPDNARFFAFSQEEAKFDLCTVFTFVHFYDEKINTVETELSDLTFFYGNHLDMSKVTPNSYIGYAGEVVKNQSGYFTSDFIKIPECYPNRKTRYIVCYSVKDGAWGANARQIYFYDSNKQSINSAWNTSSKNPESVVEVNDNAVYARVVFLDTESQFYVTFQNNTNVPNYEPFQKRIHGALLPDNANHIRNSDGAVTSLIKTALQYLHNPEIRYGNNHTPFDDECNGKYESNDGTYEGVAYQLDCSSFVELCLKGITFEGSRYKEGNEKNIEAPNAFKWNASVDYENLIDTGTYNGTFERIYANELAHYAYKNGFAYRVNKDFSNVRAGDIIFNSNCNKWYGLEFWEDIGHCMLVSQVIPRAAGGNYVKIIHSVHGDKYGVFDGMLSPADNSNIFWGARYPLPDCKCGGTNICDDFEPITIDYSTTNEYVLVKELPLNKDLKIKNAYTLAFKATNLPDDVCYQLWLSMENDWKYQVIYEGTTKKLRSDGFHIAHFEIPMSMPITNPRSARIYIKGNGVLRNGSLTLYGAKLYEGYVTPSPLEFE